MFLLQGKGNIVESFIGGLADCRLSLGPESCFATLTKHLIPLVISTGAPKPKPASAHWTYSGLQHGRTLPLQQLLHLLSKHAFHCAIELHRAGKRIFCRDRPPATQLHQNQHLLEVTVVIAYRVVAFLACATCIK